VLDGGVHRLHTKISSFANKLTLFWIRAIQIVTSWAKRSGVILNIRSAVGFRDYVVNFNAHRMAETTMKVCSSPNSGFD